MPGLQSTPTSTAKTDIRCPRCGYDQRGTVETWVDACPLHGQCVECGLVIDWARVLRMARHPWLFEYHWRQRPLLRMEQTMVRSLRPSPFWREVRLDDPIRLRVVAALAVGMVVISFLVSLGEQTVLYAELSRSWNWNPKGSWWFFLKMYLEGGWLWFTRHEVAHLIGPAVVVVSMPMVFGLIPVTLRGSRVRAAHVVRIGLFSIVGALMIFLIHTAMALLARACGLLTMSRVISPWDWRWLGTWNATWVDQLAGSLIVTLLLAGWVWWWWACACHHYLRLQRPWRTAAVLAGIGLLLAVNAQAWCSLMSFGN